MGLKMGKGHRSAEMTGSEPCCSTEHEELDTVDEETTSWQPDSGKVLPGDVRYYDGPTPGKSMTGLYLRHKAKLCMTSCFRFKHHGDYQMTLSEDLDLVPHDGTTPRRVQIVGVLEEHEQLFMEEMQAIDEEAERLYGAKAWPRDTAFSHYQPWQSAHAPIGGGQHS